MKRLILLLVLAATILTSCTKEDTDGCAAMRNLLFTHYCEYDSDESFDNWIANDVFLCIYKDKTLRHTELIPYERIKNGKIYSYPKRYDGDIDIVAWAVPARSPYHDVPDFVLGEHFDSKFLEMQPRTRATRYESFDDNIYLGVESLTDDDITVETTHNIRMINSACQVLVTLEDPSDYFNDPKKELHVLVEGVMSRMNLNYRGFGEQAEVHKNMHLESAGLRSTGYFGVLPSADDQTVDVSVYYGGVLMVTVRTGEKAVSGGRIIVNISSGTDVRVEINGYEVIASVVWM